MRTERQGEGQVEEAHGGSDLDASSAAQAVLRGFGEVAPPVGFDETVDGRKAMSGPAFLLRPMPAGVFAG